MVKNQINELLDEIRAGAKANQGISQTIDGILSGFGGIGERSSSHSEKCDYYLAARFVALTYLQESLHLEGSTAKIINSLAEFHAKQIKGYLKGPIHDSLESVGKK